MVSYGFHLWIEHGARGEDRVFKTNGLRNGNSIIFMPEVFQTSCWFFLQVPRVGFVILG
ncbi:hypothetical protein [Rubritalea tangerina]|uniref:hypothetical protein n=1 Tax=Rubritalea tangerina TaxID=430798 RepID=UPI00361D6F39